MILLKSGLDKSHEYLGAPLSAHEMGLLSTQSGPRNVVQLVSMGVNFNIKSTFDLGKKDVKADRSELAPGSRPSRSHRRESQSTYSTLYAIAS
jgi:hypothetical protein